MLPQLNPRGLSALDRAVAAALPRDLLTNVAAPQRATKTCAAPQPHNAPRKTNPAPHSPLDKPFSPCRLTAARLLLAGHRVKDVAQILNVDPYTISR